MSNLQLGEQLKGINSIHRVWPFDDADEIVEQDGQIFLIVRNYGATRFFDGINFALQVVKSHDRIATSYKVYRLAE